MSFNEHHIVNKDNFQELCLLYIDGELTPPQMDALTEFAAAHPELQEEFNALQATKLEAGPVRFEGRESLLSFHMEGGGNESLLLYLDDELPPAERDNLRRRLAEDPHYQTSFEQLKRTTLDPNEIISFPYKAMLYRRTGAAVRPLFFLRVAVAVMVVLAGVLFLLSSRNVADTAPPLIVQTPAETALPPVERDVSPLQEQIIAKEKEAPASVPQQDAKAAPAQQDRSSLAATPRRRSASPDAAAITRLAPQPPVEALTSIAAIDAADKVQRPVNKVNAIADPTQHTLNNPGVTTVPSPTYTTIDAAAPTDSGVSYAVASNNEKKGSVRGFLRKATRFIERRTGINPVNEDDELLIGVVAIKL